MTGRRLALVAGSGALVPRALAAAREAGWEVRVLTLHPRADLADEDPFQIKISRPDQVLREIRKFKATHVCAVGGMHMSDRERETLADFAGDKEETKAKGDAKLSQLGATLLKILGIPFIGVHEIVSDLLAPEGRIGAVGPDSELATIAGFAFRSARKAGELDLGQALIVSGARIIATEDIAGTDALLVRCREFRARGLVGDGAARMVLAKVSKPGQPLHVDLPAVGPDTVTAAAEAGIAAIAVEAGRTLLIEREELVARADAAGIAIIGFAAEDA
ncbi:UDP-2,3-diacylglucosamine diphosphatase LpxI domain-containing protein [Pelagibacterium xiamenense]|uniref:UDP-2,3-diacylglucosamine diphosphatase LpxI domain-containing protein n=1 Tax=Pelagibacterium xiamenense TaxID=2901140 RepID=UPI001E404D5E|nr:UDP-2,3-diacylglucosamine diphosphatase LpxI [Pelagibacterium xiamenense]MCD7060930.1 UDP-2,3-diacylglucosamine diphosphatase LpxI [Pelagibacterium xiamenense]